MARCCLLLFAVAAFAILVESRPADTDTADTGSSSPAEAEGDAGNNGFHFSSAVRELFTGLRSGNATQDSQQPHHSPLSALREAAVGAIQRARQRGAEGDGDEGTSA
ncbi:uncharacterized protein LOC126484808 [Schistocerca serialis cubense]|uniref:uncharacterized protein LOC126484808 n=1 Tax=Schistocerca serialis cubense TaxID=2023355 RepID=UPI00214E4C53|nr:uncharacterized protein LOC126484808 [Schistocerca serialis cubense]